MDDIVFQELKRVVERAVRPVAATMARKRRMREELLAHLVAIFEEEAERLGDAQAAVEQAQQRFGDPGELATQLQQAVPRWDRCRSILEDMGCRPSESAWHLAARHFLVMLLIYSALMLGFQSLLFPELRNMRPVEAQRLTVLAEVGAVPVIALIVTVHGF